MAPKAHKVGETVIRNIYTSPFEALSLRQTKGLYSFARLVALFLIYLESKTLFNANSVGTKSPPAVRPLLFTLYISSYQFRCSASL